MANGLVENFNGVLKQMLRRLCAEQPKSWNKFIDPLLFAYRETPHETTGLAPFELLYGRTVRGPLRGPLELWTEEEVETEVKNSYEYLINLKEKLSNTMEIEKEGILKSHRRQKIYYDKRAKAKNIKIGDKVLILLPTKNIKLMMQWKGPFVVLQEPHENIFKIAVNKQERVYHANLLKKYISRDKEIQIACCTASVIEGNDDNIQDEFNQMEFYEKSSDTELNINQQLTDEQLKQMKCVLDKSKSVFSNVPDKAKIEPHSIVLTSRDGQ